MTNLAGAYLILLYVAACAIIAVFGYGRRDRILGIKNYYPSPIPTVTPAPHILVHQPANNTGVMIEDFSTNQRGWNAYYWFSKVEVLNGKLLLQSNRTGYFAIATCEDPGITTLSGKYYLQADFTADANLIQPYGLVFGLGSDDQKFYLFEILSRYQTYSLLKYGSSKWNTLVPSSNAQTIRKYPESNTLSIYFDNGSVELYINGTLESTFRDQTPYNDGAFGVYVDNSGFTLLVDNFFAYYGR